MTIVIILVLVYAMYHIGHGHSNYRHAKAHGKRGIGLIWYAGRGPLVSIPIPGMHKTRITHRM